MGVTCCAIFDVPEESQDEERNEPTAAKPLFPGRIDIINACLAPLLGRCLRTGPSVAIQPGAEGFSGVPARTSAIRHLPRGYRGMWCDAHLRRRDKWLHAHDDLHHPGRGGHRAGRQRGYGPWRRRSGRRGECKCPEPFPRVAGTGTELMGIRTIPIRRAGNRDNLIMGGDRELVLFTGLLAGALIFTAQEIKAGIFGVAMWVVSLQVFRGMAKSDPKMRFVYLRQRRY